MARGLDVVWLQVLCVWMELGCDLDRVRLLGGSLGGDKGGVWRVESGDWRVKSGVCQVSLHLHLRKEERRKNM